jgi:cell division topological specificity factor
MFENIMNFFKNLGKTEKSENNNSRDTAKERLHLVLMQDRANVSADFLDLMRQEIIEVIKKYVEVDEREIDVRITNKQNDDGSNGEPALFANIPIVNIKNDILVEKKKEAEMARLENVKIETREQITENHEEENLEIRNDEHTEETNEPINEEGHKPEAVES